MVVEVGERKGPEKMKIQTPQKNDSTIKSACCSNTKDISDERPPTTHEIGK